jgi:hypothetical protein
MATAEVSLNPVNDLDVQTKLTMKALAFRRTGRHMERICDRNISLTTRVVDTSTIPCC